MSLSKHSGQQNADLQLVETTQEPAPVTTPPPASPTQKNYKSAHTGGFQDEFEKNVRHQFTTVKSQIIWNEIMAAKTQLQGEVQNLEQSVAKVLQKHELEYMQAYNIYVKRKETELKQLINDISTRLGDSVANDKKIKRLEFNEHLMKGKEIKLADQIATLKRQLKSAETTLASVTEEKTFFHMVALENKKQKKLLKVSLSRLHEDNLQLTQKCERLESELQFVQKLTEQINKAQDNTFITATASLPKIKNEPCISERSNTKLQINKSMLESINASRRVSSVTNQTATTRYAQFRIPAENLKFEQMCSIVLGSQMSKDQMKHELVNYVQTMETQYTNQLRQLRQQLEKQKKMTQLERIKNVGKVQMQSELGSLFATCVEDAKKEVVKRRLKAEIQSKGKQSQSQLEFESTLDKLADLAKGRVKCEELTQSDRANLLEVFVSNKDTLLAMNESIFQRSSELKTLQSEGINAETSSNFESREDFLTFQSRNKKAFNTLQFTDQKTKSDINFDRKYFELQPEQTK